MRDRTKPIRYAVVGASGVGIDLATVATVTRLGVPDLPSTVAAFVIAATWNYLWNRRWTFDASDLGLVAGWVEYLLAQVGALAARTVVVALLLEGGVDVIVATVLGIGVAAAGGYLVSDRWVFADEEDPAV